MNFIICCKNYCDQICRVIFSKSFGYAVRSILFLAVQSPDINRVQLDDIAETLLIPRHFLGKVMKRLAKEGILDSVKGHKGGFSINDATLSTRLAVIAELMGDGLQSNRCALNPGTCSAEHPCPIHHQLEPLKREWNNVLMNLKIHDLLAGDRDVFVKSIGPIE